MPGPRIEIEDDPTPLVLALRAELEQRLEDPEFATLTGSLRGSVALRAGAGPEAATIELGDPITIRHGSDRAQAVATLDSRQRWDGAAIEGEDGHSELARWLRELAAPPQGSWREAAARFWTELEPAPGAPAALLVVNLETAERERFGDGERAYEIHGRSEDLLALLEGRSSLIEEAFERRIYIRGRFPEISVLAGAASRVRLTNRPIHA